MLKLRATARTGYVLYRGLVSFVVIVVVIVIVAHTKIARSLDLGILLASSQWQKSDDSLLVSA